MIGSAIGNYKITEKLGEGGMGAVFKATDFMLEREVALKVLRRELASQPNVVERFRAEAVTLAKLNHPNIAALYSFFRDGDDYYMVMEFLRGETLADLLSAARQMRCGQAVPLMLQALDGIGYAHNMGVVHRDIKPANLMQTEDGLLKIMDFGIARVLGTSRMTKAGNLIGTIEYMPPEQVRGQETDARSDLYSLGMLMYELLSGKLPFQSENEYELMKMQIEQAPPPLRELAPNVPEALERVILRALAKDPADRFQTADEFREALLNVELPESEMAAAAGAASSSSSRRLSKPATSTSPNAGKETRVAGTPATRHTVTGAQIKGTRLATTPGEANGAAQPKPTVQATAMGDAPIPAKSGGLNLKAVIGGGVGILVLAGVGSFFALRGGHQPAEPVVVSRPTPPPVASTPAPPLPAPEQPAIPKLEQAEQPVIQPLAPEPEKAAPEKAVAAKPAAKRAVPKPAERRDNTEDRRRKALQMLDQ